jgi:hypothetical protein
MERSTIQRSAIHDALKRAGRPLLALEVLELACEAVPRIGIATIYRNLKTMVDEGLLRQVVLPGENPPFSVQAMSKSLRHSFVSNRFSRTCTKGFYDRRSRLDLVRSLQKLLTLRCRISGRCKNYQH